MLGPALAHPSAALGGFVVLPIARRRLGDPAAGWAAAAPHGERSGNPFTAGHDPRTAITGADVV